MSESIFQIVYCSRNNITGTAPEVNAQIENILEASRRNNARVGVTGALFYNTVFFAQVLEGSFSEVQRVFERLQLDSRHADLVVLESRYAPARDFGDWSMAYAGAQTNLHLPLPQSPEPLAGLSGTSADGEKVLSFLREVVRKQEDWALPERPSGVRALGSATVLAR